MYLEKKYTFSMFEIYIFENNLKSQEKKIVSKLRPSSLLQRIQKFKQA